MSGLERGLIKGGTHLEAKISYYTHRYNAIRKLGERHRKGLEPLISVVYNTHITYIIHIIYYIIYIVRYGSDSMILLTDSSC